MGINIPLNFAGSPSAAKPGVNIPFNLGFGLGGSIGSARQTQIVRAIAGAAALVNPAAALKVAKESKDDPAEEFDFPVQEDMLAPAVAAVDEVLRDRSTAVSVTDDDRAVAQAIGADAQLLAAARQVLKAGDDAAIAAAAPDALPYDDKGRPSVHASYWAAAIDATLFEKAARAGAKTTRLALVKLGAAVRLAEVDQKVRDLDVTVKRLQARLDEVEREEAGEGGGGGGGGMGPGGVDDKHPPAPPPKAD